MNMRVPFSGLKRWQLGVLLLAVVGLSMGMVAPHVAALHNAAWVNANVEWRRPSDGSAKPAVVDWENTCTQTFAQNKIDMRGSTQREIVNASAYIQDIWLSRRNDPPNINNPPITPGAAVNMQINDLVFLCAIITMNPSGFQIAQDHKVTNNNYPNDRAPVPDLSDPQYKVNQASRFESNSKIYGMKVISGGGSISAAPTGKVLGYARDKTSRYWKANPLPFTYNAPAGLTPGTHTIIIQLEYATIQTYHDYGSDGTSRCVLKSSGDGANVPYGRYDLCEHRLTPYSFTFTVQPTAAAATVRPESSVDKPQIGPSDTATFTHSMQVVTGTLGSATANYSIQRYRNGTPVGGPTTGTFSGGASSTNTLYTATAGDAGSTICERLTLSNPPGGTLTIVGNPSEACTIVAAEPYLKVYGGDISAGNGLTTMATGTCTSNGNAAVVSWNLEGPNFAGSGAQFATMAMAAITDFATSQGNAVGSAPAPSGLAFANTTAVGTKYGGSIGRLPCIPDYYAAKPTAPASLPGADVGALNTKAYAATGLTTFTGGTVAGGKRPQVFVDGDVYIKGNIVYGPAWTVDNIPLFELVVRGNIYIDKSVSQLDGAYIAQAKSDGSGGIIYTCTTGAAPFESTNALTDVYAQCKNSQLQVNGALTAASIQFLRAKGTLSGSPTDSPATLSSNAAEQLNFGPSLWIAQPNTATGPVPGYDSIASLPPVL